jgi:ABC-type transporter Mla subunit MlaD
MPSPLIAAGLLAACLSLVGCSTTLPDVSPFAEATDEASVAVDDGFQAMGESYDLLTETLERAEAAARSSDAHGRFIADVPTRDEWLGVLSEEGIADPASLGVVYDALFMVAMNPREPDEKRETAATFLDTERLRETILSMDPAERERGVRNLVRFGADASELFSLSAERIRDRAAQHAAALDGFARYADRLEAIVDSAESESQRVEAYTNAVASLAGELGGVFPAAGAAAQGVGVIANAVADLARTFAERRALGALDDAVAAADPQIRRVASLIRDDIRMLAAEQASLRAAFIENFNVAHPEVQHLRALIDERRAQLIGDASSSNVLDTLDAIDRLNATVKSVEWLREIDEQRDEGARLIAESTELLNDAARVVGAWEREHASLAAAISDGRDVDPQRIVEAVSRVRETIDQVRAWRATLVQNGG